MRADLVARFARLPGKDLFLARKLTKYVDIMLKRIALQLEGTPNASEQVQAEINTAMEPHPGTIDVVLRWLSSCQREHREGAQDQTPKVKRPRPEAQGSASSRANSDSRSRGRTATTHSFKTRYTQRPPPCGPGPGANPRACACEATGFFFQKHRPGCPNYVFDLEARHPDFIPALAGHPSAVAETSTVKDEPQSEEEGTQEPPPKRAEYADSNETKWEYPPHNGDANFDRNWIIPAKFGIFKEPQPTIVLDFVQKFCDTQTSKILGQPAVMWSLATDVKDAYEHHANYHQFVKYVLNVFHSYRHRPERSPVTKKRAWKELTRCGEHFIDYLTTEIRRQASPNKSAKKFDIVTNEEHYKTLLKNMDEETLSAVEEYAGFNYQRRPPSPKFVDLVGDICEFMAFVFVGHNRPDLLMQMTLESAIVKFSDPSYSQGHCGLTGIQLVERFVDLRSSLAETGRPRTELVQLDPSEA